VGVLFLKEGLVSAPCGFRAKARRLLVALLSAGILSRILEYLIRNRERLAGKDDLLAVVWNGRIVSESTLSTRITAARTALGDSGEEHRLIRTAHGKGP